MELKAGPCKRLWSCGILTRNGGQNKTRIELVSPTRVKDNRSVLALHSYTFHSAVLERHGQLKEV